jgi:hypothetical protein
MKDEWDSLSIFEQEKNNDIYSRLIIPYWKWAIRISPKLDSLCRDWELT